MNQTSVEILFEKFEVISCLKKDSHTAVYLANHVYLGKRILLKTLNTDNLPEKSILERFKREAKILAQLEHPNLIKVLDFGNYSHFFYISFEYFESSNLREVIKNNNLNFDEKKSLAIQLLRALNAAHRNNIIHRDIKPENILVNKNLELKIADFGLALVQNEHNLTQKSSIVGTPSYMSPEQIRGESLTLQTDLFSSGIVIYELFTGGNPLLGKDLSATINNILNFNETRLTEIEKLPADIQKVISGTVQKSLASRIKSASEGLIILGYTDTLYDIPAEHRAAGRSKKIWLYLIPLVIISGVISWLAYINYFPAENTADNSQKVQDSSNAAVSDSLLTTAKENPADTKIPPVKDNAGEERVLLPAGININVTPWATVYIDNESYGETPLRKKIELKPGYHTIRLENYKYPTITRRVYLKPGVTENLKMYLDDYVGHVVFKVEPWGDVFINEEPKGRSAEIAEPIPLLPRTYNIRIVNPSFGTYEKRIRIREKQTSVIEFNFKSLKQN